KMDRQIYPEARDARAAAAAGHQTAQEGLRDARGQVGQRRAADIRARRLRARQVEKARTLQPRLRRAAAGRTRTRRGRPSKADLDAADFRDVAVDCEVVETELPRYAYGYLSHVLLIHISIKLAGGENTR